MSTSLVQTFTSRGKVGCRTCATVTNMWRLALSWPVKGLVTNYGEGGGGTRKQEGEGRACEVLVLRKGGAGGKSFRHAKGGEHNKF